MKSEHILVLGVVCAYSLAIAVACYVIDSAWPLLAYTLIPRIQTD